VTAVLLLAMPRPAALTERRYSFFQRLHSMKGFEKLALTKFSAPPPPTPPLPPACQL
jgi:hypothetical protein